MDQPKPVRTSIFFYVPLAIAGLLLIVYVFIHNYKKGEEAGLTAPPPAEGVRTSGATAINHRALARDTGLAAKGRTLFQINCASCHGPDGHGNGDRAASLNPKPRNFHTEKFKFGNDIVSVHRTILKGSPGTSMPSFALLPVEDTWAMAHFVLTQVPNAPPITDSLLAQVSAGETAGGTQVSAATAASDTLHEGNSPRIPVRFAMERLEHESPGGSTASKTMEAGHPGRAVYVKHCASCHGEAGEGRPTAVASVAPYRYVSTGGSLQDKNAPWRGDRNEFGRMVVKGLPGRLMPGSATLTKQQINDLFDYVQKFPDHRMKSARRPTP